MDEAAQGRGGHGPQVGQFASIVGGWWFGGGLNWWLNTLELVVKQLFELDDNCLNWCEAAQGRGGQVRQNKGGFEGGLHVMHVGKKRCASG